VEHEDGTQPPLEGDFGECLSWLLAESGKSQAWLARRLGVTDGAVTQWKQGRTTPRDRTVDQINSLLGGEERLGAGTLRRAAERSRSASASRPPADNEPTSSAAADPVDLLAAQRSADAMSRWRRRPRLLLVGGVVAVALVLVVVVVVVAGVLTKSWRREEPRPPTVTALPPPPDVLLYEVWRSGSQAHVHVVEQRQWAMTRFRATQPFLRSVEVNIDGPTVVHLSVLRYRQGAADPWQQVARPVQVAVVPNGHTKVIYDPVIPVTPGELLYLQVYNPEPTKLAIYFSNHHEGADPSYLWCSRPAIRCVHPDSLNAIVYGWPRAA
jgi:transcriptional regulator with XRE-family HTH domain